MDIFNRFGDLIIRTVSFIGMLILSIPKIPKKFRNVSTSGVKNKIDKERIKDNLSRVKDEVGGVIENQKQPEVVRPTAETGGEFTDSDTILISGTYTSEEKERTILILQIAAASFIVLSIFNVFNFISILLFMLIGSLISAFIIYILYTRVKKMYRRDFNAYRDFFLMYLAVGVIIVLISMNSYLILAFSFQSLPSLSVLIYAVIAVAAVFLIFRIRYKRNFTYGTVLEVGENTAHVKIEYDIRANVKPNIYLVENRFTAMTGDIVKLKVEENLISTGGNKPLEVIEVYKK